MALIRDFRGGEYDKKLKEGQRIVLTTMLIATLELRKINKVREGGFIYLPSASILEASGYDKNTYHMRSLKNMSDNGLLFKKKIGRKLYYCLPKGIENWLVDAITAYAVAPVILSQLKIE